MNNNINQLDKGDDLSEGKIKPAKDTAKTIYLLPNLFTTGALFCGFYAILSAHEGRFSLACALIFIAMILDGVDGRIARLTHTESDFGVQYDSLSDLLCFGVAPALILYQWSLFSIRFSGWLPSKLGWMAAFVYTACAALRLARFNTQCGSIDKAIFIGLPTPAAAVMMVSFVLLGQDLRLDPQSWAVFVIFLLLFAAFLMVSNIAYFSFKRLRIRDRIRFHLAVLPVLIFGLIFLYPERALFTIFVCYALHGPVWWLWRFYQHRCGSKVS